MALLPYAPTWKAPFVYDDFPYLVENADLNGGISRIPHLFSSSFPSRAPERGLYRPVTAASFLIDRAAGKGAGFSHALNSVLAALLAVAVYHLLERIVSRPGAAAGALLFAVHPVHVEAVAWVSGRAEILAALFATAAIALAADFVATGAVFRVALSSALLFLGVLSKENAAVAGVLFGVFSFEKFSGRGRNRILVALSGFAAASGLALVMRHSALGALTALPAERVGPSGFLERLPLAVAATGEHLRLLLWPHPLTIERMPVPPLSWGESPVLAGAVVLAIWATGAFLLRRRKDLFFLAVWPPLALLPVSHLVPIGETVAERFLLFPSIGFAGLAGELLAGSVAGARKTRRFALTGVRGLTLGALILVGLGLTGSRATVWRSESALWRDAARHEPRSASVWAGLGDAERRGGFPERAIAHYRKSLSIDPALTPARLSLATCLESGGNFEEALRETKMAVELDPQDAPALNNLGARLARVGKGEEARELYRRAVLLSPRYTMALRNLALSALEAGDLDEAREALRRARALDPELPDLETLEARVRPSREASSGR